MGLLKSKPAKAAAPEPFRVPSLVETDPEYAELIERRASLQTTHARLQAEARQLEQDLAREPVPAFRPEVAELLGEAAGNASALHQQIREKRSQIAHHEAALQVLEERIRGAENTASVKACEVVRPEYARRVQAVCRALMDVDAAHRELEDLKNAMERENIRWTRLTPLLPTFLGTLRDNQSRISRYFQEVKEAGYDVD
jgi:chromosome segregation ATPase